MTYRQEKLIENYVRKQVRKSLREASTFRTVKVNYSDGNSISTNMNGAVTDEEIKRYYRVGSTATFETNGRERKVKITSVEILPDETY